MAKSTPLISVLMPFYDDGSETARRHFSEALHSVLSQTLQDFEVVLVYSGHSDFVKEQAKKSNKIRLVYFKQKPFSGKLPLADKIYGLVTSRNMCIQNARGKFIAYADCDDISLPSRLATQCGFLKTHPGVGVVGSAMLLIDERGKEVGTRQVVEKDANIRRSMLQFNPVPQPTVMAYLSLVKQAGAYRQGELSEDFNLWVRMSRLTKFHNLQESLIKYRVHAGGGVSKYKFPVYFASLRTKLYAAKALGIFPGLKDIAVNLAQFASLFFPDSIRRTMLERARSKIVIRK